MVNKKDSNFGEIKFENGSKIILNPIGKNQNLGTSLPPEYVYEVSIDKSWLDDAKNTDLYDVEV